MLACKVFVLTWLRESWLLRCTLFISVAVRLVALDVPGRLLCIVRQGHHLNLSKG
jgi:hypothetical protein